MEKRWVVTIIVWLIVLTSILSGVSNTDQAGALENRDDPDGGDIHFDEVKTGRIDPSSDIDTYTFNGEVGWKIIRMQMNRLEGNIYPEIRLYDPNGEAEFSHFDTSSSGGYHAEIIDHILEHSGIYSVMVQDHDGTHTGSYDLHLSFALNPGLPAFPPCDDIQFNETKNGTIQDGPEVDLYTFNGEMGWKIIRLQMNRDEGDIYPEIRLYDPDGNLEISHHDTSSSGGYHAEIIDHVLEHSGNYSIAIQDHFGTQTGNYTLYLSFALNITSDSIPICDEIEYDETKTGIIQNGPEMALYTFRTERNWKIIRLQMNVIEGDLYPEIRLYDPDGDLEVTHYDTSSSGGYSAEIADHTLEHSGFYSVVVQDYYGTRTGNWSLYLAEPWKPPTPGVPLNLSTEIGEENITLSWDSPWYPGNTSIINYTIYRGNTSGYIKDQTFNTTSFETVGNVTTFTDTNVTEGWIYSYRITAANSYGEGLVTDVVNVTFPGTPGPPVDVKPYIGNDRIMIAWSEPEFDGTFPVICYNLYRGTGVNDLSLVAEEIHGPMYVDTNVMNENSYDYLVTAVNSYGEGTGSSVVSATPLSPENAYSFVEDFEDGDLKEYDIEVNGAVPYGFTPDYKHDGKYAMSVGPSSCGYDCNDDYAVKFIAKDINLSWDNYSISYWRREPNDLGGTLKIGINDNVEFLDNGPYHNHYGDSGWYRKEFLWSGSMDSIYFRETDITSYGRTLLDDIIIRKCDYLAPSQPLNSTAIYNNGSIELVWNAPDYTGNFSISSNLLGYWKFDEGAGYSAEDASGGGFNGTLSGGVTWTEGKDGNGVRCDDSTEYINLPAIGIGSTHSIAVWSQFPLYSPTLSGWRTLVQTQGGDQHHIIVYEDGTLGIYNDGWFPSGYNVNNLNGWHHITAVAWGSTTEFYIDGSYVGTSNTVVTTDISRLGNHDSEQQWGTFDEVAVFNRALSAGEVELLYTHGMVTFNNDVTYYCVYYGTDVNNLSLHTTSTDVTSFTDTNVDENRTYYYRLSAVNSMGEGLKTGIIDIYSKNIDTGLVASYNFDDGRGIIACDSSGNGNGGVIYGEAAWVDGVSGKALRFDGMDDRVLLPFSVMDGLVDVTVEFWIRTNAEGMGIISGANSYMDNEYLIWSEYGGITPYIKGYDYQSKTLINDGNWHHIAVVRTGVTVTVYVDGMMDILRDSAHSEPLSIEPNGLWIGGDQDHVGGGWVFDQQFNGTLDEVRIYERTLSMEEISGHYDSHTPAPSKPLNLLAVPGDGNISLSWSPPQSEGGTPVTSYRIYRGISEDSLLLLNELHGDSGYLDNEVTNGDTYYYRVSAVNSMGEGRRSEIVQATPSKYIAAPSSPRSLFAIAWDGEVELNWQEPLANGGSSITNYKVYRGTSSGSLVLLTTLNDVLTYIDTSVAENRTYYYQVSAVNIIGEGARSSEINVTITGIGGGIDEYLDLSISSTITVLPSNPSEEDYITLSVTVHNLGQRYISLFEVALYCDYIFIEKMIVEFLSMGDSQTVEFNCKMEEGYHDIRIEIDPDNSIIEIREDNNIARIQLEVTSEGEGIALEGNDSCSLSIGIFVTMVIIIIILSAIVKARKKRRENGAEVSSDMEPASDHKPPRIIPHPRCFVPDISTKCKICLGYIKGGGEAFQCTCGKVFHTVCAERVGECPMCGEVFSKEDTVFPEEKDFDDSYDAGSEDTEDTGNTSVSSGSVPTGSSDWSGGDWIKEDEKDEGEEEIEIDEDATSCTERSEPRIRNTDDSFNISDIFLIYVDGRLIKSVSISSSLRKEMDEDIMSGMFTAVSAFITDSFSADSGSLKMLQHGKMTIYLEQGVAMYLAVVFHGKPPGNLRRKMRKALIKIWAKYRTSLKAWDGSYDGLDNIENKITEFLGIENEAVETKDEHDDDYQPPKYTGRIHASEPDEGELPNIVTTADTKTLKGCFHLYNMLLAKKGLNIEIGPGSTPSEVARVRKRIITIYHPDKWQTDKKKATFFMQKVNVAWEVLSRK